MNYYNEFDPHAAAWLRELIEVGAIPAGHVDERSIEDVLPSELTGYTQCHFFAGIGGWSLALQLAGWPEDRPVWTGSCPCQPFSAAGAGSGFADERHLWPAFFHLIEQCRPAAVFGEQVASKAVNPWIDLVQADLEGVGYTVGAVAFPAAGVGAPHIRDRTYWVAYSTRSGRREEYAQPGGLVGRDSAQGLRTGSVRSGSPDRLAEHHAESRGGVVGLADAKHDGCCGSQGDQAKPSREGVDIGLLDGGRLASERHIAAGPTNGQWRDADWLGCRDGKWRPVEARSQQMAYGLSSLMGYGRDSCDAYQTARKEIDDWCSATQTGPREALHDLWLSLAAQADAIRSIGGPGGVPSPSVLLAFLRELACKGWHVEEGVSRAGAEATQTGVRKLWVPNETARSPFERGLAQQRPEQSADALHFLSSILARHASSAWPEAVSADAEVGFPLGVGSPARVGRLRGYGNAIVPQAAAEFIASAM